MCSGIRIQNRFDTNLGAKPVAVKKEEYIPKKEVKMSSVIRALKITHWRTIPGCLSTIDSVHGAVAFPEFFFPLLSQCIYR